MRALIASILLLAALPGAAAAAKPNEYAGRWIRSCQDGTNCRIIIERTSKKDVFRFTFLVTRPDPGVGQKDCDWHVDMSYSRADGDLWATDPYDNYGFYVSRRPDGSLRSSGTMLQVCGLRPMEDVFLTDTADEFGDE
jgi:hypothetical protein